MQEQEYTGNGIQEIPSQRVLHAQPEPQVDYDHLIKTIAAWRGILNARLLALLALVGALVMFAFAMYDPTNLRLTGVSLYSVGVLWPVIALFLRKG